jgi:hypothetical protein
MCMHACVRMQMSLYVANPNKYRALEFLIDTHKKRNDKIMVCALRAFVPNWAIYV